MKFRLLLPVLMLAFTATVMAQKPADRRDKGAYIEAKKGYYQTDIMKDISAFEDKNKVEKPHRVYKMDVTGVDVPKSVKEFSTIWKQNPISQGNTGTCWCYSTSSYFESEIYRLTKQQIKLSEAYTVYWEYVEKARRFVRERGNSNFDEGSEANAVVRMYKMYGALPAEAYTGRPNGEPFNNHEPMANEMRAYLQTVKASNAWNEGLVIETIKSILDHYMGTPPTSFTYAGNNRMTPTDFLKDVLRLNMDDYFDMMSLATMPYWETGEYTVPDNWWHADNYYNIPLDDYMALVKKSVKAGYGLFIGGDVSEPGFNAMNNIVMVPSFDIPSSFIDENARAFRFHNGTTTDDHGMHLCGWTEKNGQTWYLVKDSGSGSRNCGAESENFGYYFFHEDYMKLKIMGVLVHRDMVKDLLPKFAVKGTH